MQATSSHLNTHFAIREIFDKHYSQDSNSGRLRAALTGGERQVTERSDAVANENACIFLSQEAFV